MIKKTCMSEREKAVEWKIRAREINEEQRQEGGMAALYRPSSKMPRFSRRNMGQNTMREVYSLGLDIIIHAQTCPSSC